jgi:hypothetical protein
MSRDVWSSPALSLVVELQHQGFELEPAGDRIRVRPASLLTAAQRVQLGQQRAAVLTLLRICDEGVVARREVFQQQLKATAPPAVPSFVFTAGVPYVPGACFSCGEANGRETYGRCWRCALAWRLVCRLAIPTDVAIVIDGARRDS